MRHDIHFKGRFITLADAWEQYPGGGTEGDYIFIGDGTHPVYWDLTKGEWRAIMPEIDNDGYWYIPGYNGRVRICDSNGAWVPATHTVRWDEETNNIIIDEGRTDASGQSIEQVITALPEAIAEMMRLYASAEEHRDSEYAAAEEARDSRYAAAEGTKSGSQAGDQDRWGQYKAAEAARNNQYATAEDTRDNKYDAAETSRGERYAQAETARGGQYDAAEASRNENFEEYESQRFNRYTHAEGDRNDRYASSEARRESLYSQAENTRTGKYNAAEQARDTLYGRAELARQALYETAEGERQNTFVENEGDRQAAEEERETAEAAREFVKSQMQLMLDNIVANFLADTDLYEEAVAHGYRGTRVDWLTSWRGFKGVGVKSVTQITHPTGSGEENTVRVTLDNGVYFDFKVNNGLQGNTGSSVDYPFELVNNLTTDDAQKALSAAMGKALADSRLRFDASQTLSAVERQQVQENLGIVVLTESEYAALTNPDSSKIYYVYEDPDPEEEV